MAEEFKSRDLGAQAEGWACAFLLKQGLKLRERNFSCRCGEIDLIMQDKDEIVFVEVRRREDDYLGSALESVTKPKQKRLIKTAMLYLQKMGLVDKAYCRFDVVGMSGDRKVEWVKNAFVVGFC